MFSVLFLEAQHERLLRRYGTYEKERSMRFFEVRRTLEPITSIEAIIFWDCALLLHVLQ